MPDLLTYAFLVVRLQYGIWFGMSPEAVVCFSYGETVDEVLIGSLADDE